MGYYVITNLVKERIIMSNEIIVKLEEGLYEEYLEDLDGLNKLAEIMNSMKENMNLMATKDLELEEKQKKTIEELSKYERVSN